MAEIQTSSGTIASGMCHKALQTELAKLNREPVEGFIIKANEENILEWDVVIFGPPETPYAGGYFKAKMTFPSDYPYSPPKFAFKTSLWHPNIYMNGDVCISILHPPGNDPMSGELPNERWNPTQSVRTILLSVQSLLNEPNTSSAANVDASVMYRRWREGKKGGEEYSRMVQEQVDESRKEAEKDQVQVPKTLQEYLAMSKPQLEPDRDPDSGYDQDDQDGYDPDYFMDDDSGEDNEQSGGEGNDQSGEGAETPESVIDTNNS